MTQKLHDTIRRLTAERDALAIANDLVGVRANGLEEEVQHALERQQKAESERDQWADRAAKLMAINIEQGTNLQSAVQERDALKAALGGVLDLDGECDCLGRVLRQPCQPCEVRANARRLLGEVE